MQKYTRNIILISICMYGILPLGFAPALFYTMSSSPDQMKTLGLYSVLIWLAVSAFGLLLTYFLCNPVQTLLLRLHNGAEVQEEELIHAAQKNKRLPFMLSLLDFFMFIFLDICWYMFYRLSGIGPFGAGAIFFTLIAGGVAGPLCLSGTLYFVISPAHNLLYQASQRRGIGWNQRGTGLGRGILTNMVLICIGIAVWMSMPGLYEGMYCLRREASRDILASHAYALRGMQALKGASISVGDLKMMVNDLEACGLGPSFLADAKGNILYNPDNIEIFNQQWEDINTALRAALASGTAGSYFENVHEQLICYTPLPGGMVAGTVVRLKDRLPWFGRFWVVFIFMGLVVIFMVSYVSIAMVASIVKPITLTKKRMQDLAAGEGDLTQRMAVLNDDESGALAAEINVFVSALEKIISQVRNTSHTVSSSTGEVAAGSQGLSQTTQEQAAAIEEVAASIEEMTASIKLNAQSASAGRQKVGEMVHMADDSGHTARDLEKGMSAISEASKKIGDIITTVNEVAFQTNLLALNAAVEAARAGEHGKGFAVVAEEVRALAGRSASAVREIKGLIDDTVAKIAAGDIMAKKSGSSLQKIISHIHELTQTMDEIAAASSEQASGVEEVNRAIAQIDASTQRNASTVEELSSNADSLNTETEELLKAVMRFKVSQEE